MRREAIWMGMLALTLALAGAQTPRIELLTEQELNDTIGTAHFVGVVGRDATNQRVMKVIRGLINPDGDLDFFRFQVLQSGTYTFRVDVHGDSVLALYNSSGGLIAENDDDVPGDNTRGNRDTSFTNADSGITINLSAGTYLVQVRSIATSGDLARFRYTLRLFDGSTAPDYDPYEVSGTNDTFSTATDVGNLADDFTLISNAFLNYRQSDRDFYRFEIGAGNLTVRTFGATDTILTVYDSSLNPLATNDDDPHDPFNPFTSRVALTGLPAGIYYIRVEGFFYPGGIAGGWYDVLLTDYTPVRRLLSGRILFSHQAIQNVPFTFEIREPGSNQVRQTRSVYSDANGNFTFYTRLMSGTYHIACRAPTSLWRVIRNVSLDTNVSGLVFNLVNGDINQDNLIDDADLLRVLFAFGQSGANLPEDLNGDGIVDDADLLTVLFNFGAVGDS
ncbi:MAG: DVUA0089 family protein [Armatimonadota bacterium]